MTQTTSEHDLDFVKLMVHDLKNPLSAVKSYVDLIQQIGGLNNQQEHFSNKAMDAIERMERMIGDLLDIARIESDVQLESNDCDFAEMAQEVLDTYEYAITKKNITIHLELDPQLSIFLGDKTLLTHVISNLVGNAIKYNRDDGTVWLSISQEPAYLRVDVRDTGEGIPQEDLKKIFDHFFRSRHNHSSVQGNGLGLAIAKMVVEKHDGHLWVESKVAEGSHFSFTLPRSKASTDADTEESSNTPTSPKNFEPHPETAIEPMDAVEDDLQESAEHHDDGESDEYLST